jgi:hypothetical protein
LQVPLICFAAFENHFRGHEEKCTGVYRGTFSADNPLKFSKEVSFCGLHGRILELKVEDINITGECYRRWGFRSLTGMCTVGLQIVTGVFWHPNGWQELEADDPVV